MTRSTILVIAVFILSGCQANPVLVKKMSADRFALTYELRAADNVNRMQSQFMLKAQEVCRGAYKRLSESEPSWWVRQWDVQCLR